ncbi:Autoinducer 2 sensor kinase/phosphatase [Lysobacter dokdonensis DS-58]|uniref:histidine kinase n=1 Tax=Lysobacter dokdonensis DS-58 TaxID=1300345 RepID=A0A0A2WF58_9GAMM|nr:ATP-binding protein [Lysobacter dokdonensis]KGQ18836.1 Autoinducer 2 sensor kinase/phosphatase [Lysobacter dokdonensis DS-58]
MAPKAQDELFAGGGETGALMRSIDWSRTPLGPVEDWPQSLRTCVRVLLTSRQPMFVWWGESLVNLYNDAYRAILGGKHPQAMGQPAAQVWREIWEQIQPRAVGAIEANEGTYDEALLLIMERNGYPEETYYTFSYSPVPDDDGRPNGIFCANTEDTRRIVGERQTALQRDLAARTGDARTVDEACELSAQAFATDPRDLPFALLYESDVGDDHARLCAASGIAEGHAAAPVMCALEGATWPLGEAMRTHAPQIVDCTALPGELPVAAWDVPPRQAVVLPVPHSGNAARNAWFVAALNPYRLLDVDYLAFLHLVAGQVGASISNAQAYEDERRRAEALAELDRAKTAFFSNISHEFRTPLTLLLAPVEESLRNDAQALIGEDLVSVHRNAQRLLRLVNALLDFSRIEAGRVEARYVPVALGPFTAELASMFRSATEKAGLRLDVDVPALSSPVHVDRDMWEKIVLNLLSNAFKFTFQGGIRVALRELPDDVELVVEDTGIGIAQEEVPRLFERFHRVQDARARTHEGSGIGLALVLELVKMHGGRIEAHSAPGVGTRFTVTIPRGTAHLAPGRIGEAIPDAMPGTAAASYVQEAERWLDATDPSPAPASAHERARGTILLADDNADMRDYVRRLLEGDGYAVRTVGNGNDALELALASPPDLVLTDVMMPGLDGFGLTAALREDAQTRNLPIVMLSARAGEDARAEGVEGGADDYLVKPFSAKELLARVSLQIERAQRRTEVERQRAELRGLFEQAPACIALLRGDAHVFELANPPYLKLFGGRQILGKPVREALPELEGQPFFTLLDQVLRTGTPYVGTETSVYMDATNTGRIEERVFNFLYQPIRESGSGEVDSILVFAYEVTEAVLARRRVESLMQQLTVADQRKDEFLAMLAHELRNPLAPVRNAIALLQTQGGTDERTRYLLDVLQRQTANLGRLVNDLLDVSRITRGLIEIDRARVDLRSVVDRAMESVQSAMDDKRHDVVCIVPGRPAVVDGDPVRLEQVLVNLLTNACKYTDPGGRITVELRLRESVVELSVRDDGIGMLPATIAHVFTLFSQAERGLDRAQGGLGIGLTVVRSLVELHGGSVEARSDGLGKGTEFAVTLPLAQSQFDGQLRAPIPERGAMRPQRVLVVDDNVDAARTLAHLLEDFGHHVQVAHDGDAALAMAHSTVPELVLLDIGLPGMNGYEVVRRLREDPVTRDATVVAVTGYGQGADRQRTLAAGFDQHLVKPVATDQLQALFAA